MSEVAVSSKTTKIKRQKLMDGQFTIIAAMQLIILAVVVISSAVLLREGLKYVKNKKDS